MNSKKLFLFVGLLILIMAIVLGWNLLKKSDPSTTEVSEQNNSREEAPPEIEENYKKNLHSLISPVLMNEPIEGVLTSVQELIVPREFQKLHLEIVIALNKIETGIGIADQAMIEQGYQELEELAKLYPWIL